MRFLTGAVLHATAAHNAFAQSASPRPESSSICDHYAAAKYGSNSTANQLLLMQHIVTLAFGGRGSLTDAPETSTGIWNVGTFENDPVDLRSWFDGSKRTTNLNNQAVGINWVDGGGVEPLHAFLNGSTKTVVMANSTNQYRLLTDFYRAFGFVFECSSARSFPRAETASTGPINLAYVHKFMNLNSTHLGHFINQLTDAAKYYGFSTADANTLENLMNSRYNVRCNPSINGQLYSLCQAPECPLAAPRADCAAYANLRPEVNGTGAGTGGGGGASPSSTGAPGATSPAATTPTPTPEQSQPALGAGPIAGIAIGGAVVLLAAVGMVLWHRRRKGPKIVAVPMGPGGPGSPYNPSYSSPGGHLHHSMQPSMSTQYNPHQSYMSHTPSEAGTYGNFQPKPEDQLVAGAYNHQPHSPGPMGQQPPMREIAEMESPPAPAHYDNHQSLPAVASQDYGTAAGHDSPRVTSTEYAPSTVGGGPISPYNPASPHQSGMPPERRDHGPGNSVWQ